MLASLLMIGRVLLSLPHLLVLLWLLWLAFLPAQVKYLLRKDATSYQLKQTGELMNFREIFAVGCVGGFILLSFITAYCTYLTLGLNGVI